MLDGHVTINGALLLEDLRYLVVFDDDLGRLSDDLRVVTEVLLEEVHSARCRLVAAGKVIVDLLSARQPKQLSYVLLHRFIIT